MAVQRHGNIVSFESAADLSTKQYHVVKMTSAGKVNLASAGTDVSLGVLYNKPKTGEAAEVLMRNSAGTGKVIIGGTVTLGAALTANASGKAIATTTAGDQILGYALEAGSADDIIEFMPTTGKV